MQPSNYPQPKTEFLAGEVALVGAGPGDAELLTIKALNYINQAQVVIYDRLVSDEILALLPENCERFYVGKAQANHCVPQNNINQMLIDQAKLGRKVLRLKGGDPFVFGRGGEEMAALMEQGIACHVCPGVTAASACTTYAGIPLTFRGIAQSCTLVTGHMQNDGQLNLPWQALANKKQTLVFYMGITTLPTICQQLHNHGLALHTPAAVIANGTRAEQLTVRGSLENLPDLVAQHHIKPPALVVVGDVVNQFAEIPQSEFGYFKVERKLSQLADIA